jgi:SGNH hydrolase-like domain, acetyltransferase AlgX
MKRVADPRRGLILMFLGIIAVVPSGQAFLELRRGERSQSLELFDRRPTAENLRAFEHDLEGASHAAKAARPWVQFARFQWLRDGGEKALVGRHGWLFYRPSVEYVLDQATEPSPAKPSDDPLPAILAFRDGLAARGVRLLVVPVPNKESIYPEHLTSRVRSADVLVCESTRRLLSRLSAAGVEFVDLFQTFSEEKQRTPGGVHAPLYLAQDTHWSPAGLEVAARTVARRILGRGWLTDGAVAYETRPVDVARLGDVLRMLQAEPIERLAVPEQARCEQVVRSETGRPYRDEGDAEVLVLGDSFLRIFEQDEPGSAGFLAHLARAMGRPLTSLVSDGGASTLVRQELYRRPALLRDKKVVVWEFVERDVRLGTEGWQLVPLPSATAQRQPSRPTRDIPSDHQ